MISLEKQNSILKEVIEQLDLPDSAYEKAVNRYESLGDWFDREDSQVNDFNPHIFAQGSFRLGTAIKPLNGNESYDLDLACKLRSGITKQNYTQVELKRLIGNELEGYRVAKQIKEELEEKHRCWRLEYQDDISFHMDIVPCIPEDDDTQALLMKSITSSGIGESLAQATSSTTVSITDDRHESYDKICGHWLISNPEGYATWFESQMSNQSTFMIMEKAQVDDIPLYRRKTPLQQVIQLLKRHRDSMYIQNEDCKPISIIITTLSSKAYNGERDIATALENVLGSMKEYINPSYPRVPNPVDPNEDFADRWSMPQYQHLRLEDNFNAWLYQAKEDFRRILSSERADFIAEQVEGKLSAQINKENLLKKLGIGLSGISIVTPKKTAISEPAKPWRMK